MQDVNIVISCQTGSEELCLNELSKTGFKTHFGTWLDSGVCSIHIDGTFSEFSDAVRRERLIFLQHIFPVDVSINYSESGQLPSPSDILDGIASRMDKLKTFSVQLRKKDVTPEAAQKLKREMQEHLEAQGYSYQTGHPEQIVSVFLTAEQLLIGLSYTKENLSDWPGGMRAYAYREDTISRAEFKLLEAIECFSLELPTDGLAVDLGAAPGGWSKVLLEKGLRVIAVDPANLSPVIENNPNLTHFKGLAQSFLEKNDMAIDLLLNDMRMDTLDSIKITNDMAPCVKKGGLVIITFKLPKKGKMALVNKGLSLISREYSVLHARQLFHNRSEITVVAKKVIA